MRVFERIGRMLRADAHGMMDQLEERSWVLRQNLREAENEVARKRAVLEALEEERRTIREEGVRLEARVTSLDADVALAIEGDDPELARYAVRRLIPQKAALHELFARATELDGRRARLVERLEAQQSQLDELRPRVRAKLARSDVDALSFDVCDSVTEEEVDLELLRRRSMAGAGGRAETEAAHERATRVVTRAGEEGR